MWGRRECCGPSKSTATSSTSRPSNASRRPEIPVAARRHRVKVIGPLLMTLARSLARSLDRSLARSLARISFLAKLLVVPLLVVPKELKSRLRLHHHRMMMPSPGRLLLSGQGSAQSTLYPGWWGILGRFYCPG